MLQACDAPDSNSLFTGEFDVLPQPVVNEMNPSGQFFAGIGEIELLGQNFTTNTDNIAVYFDNVRATILEHDGDGRLVIRPPNMTGDSIKVRVRVLGSDKFSETIYYTLEDSYKPLAGQRPSDEPLGVGYGNGDFNFTGSVSGSPGGVRAIGPDGMNREIAPPQPFNYNRARVGPDDRVYLSRGGIIPIVYVIETEGTNPAIFANPSGVRTESFEFDSRGNMWGGGQNEGRGANFARLYKRASDGSLTFFQFDYDVRAVRYFDGSIYVAASQNVGTHNSFKVFRVALDADYEAESYEVYHDMDDLGGAGSSFAIRDITFAADGTLYIGTNRSQNSIYTVSPQGERDVLHPGIIDRPVRTFTWEEDTNWLIATLQRVDDERPASIVRIQALKPGAPYY